VRIPDWRKILITLIITEKGEETAHTGVIADFANNGSQSVGSSRANLEWPI